MALELTIKECSAGLASQRATERKKNAETMKDFLTRNAVPTLLSENTKRKKGFTWNNLFDDINEMILKETEKFESSKTFETVTGPLCTTLLHLCVAGANKGQVYINCEKIMDMCLYILKDNRLTKAFGDAYLHLLYKHVLPCNHYLSYITPTAWEDLFDICLSVNLPNSCKLDDFTKMRLLYLVMNNGRNCSQFVIPLRDSLSKFRKCCYGVAGEKKVQEVVIEIVILLLETLSSECRLSMCDFTENIFNSVLKFYDHNLDQKKKSSLFRLMHMTMTLHHPQGRKQHEEGSLANDWNLWNKHIQSLLEIVCLEVAHFQKLRKQNDISMKQCDDFFNLSAAVFYQIFNSPVPSNEDENGNASKRQRTTFNKNKSFNDMIEELRQNNVPWIAITNKYVKNFGNSISTVDYLALTNVVESLITDSNKNVDWEIFEVMACSTVRYITTRSTGLTEDYDAVLLSLWNSCVRTSTMVNPSHRALHSIMQFLLRFDTVNYENVQPLIKLYFEKGMPVTDHSLKTLNCVFNKFFSKCSSTIERNKFFAWLSHGSISSVDIAYVKELLLRLLVIENVNVMQIYDSDSEYVYLHDILFNSVEKCLMFSEFEFDITPTQKQTTQDCPPERNEINIEMDKELNDYLNGKLIEYTNKFRGQEISLLDYMKVTNVTLNCLDITLKHNLKTPNDLKTHKMYILAKTALKVIFASATRVLTSTSQIPGKIALLEYLESILVTEHDPMISSEIRLCINEEFFHTINTILNSEVVTDDGEVVYEGDDLEINPNALRHHCIFLLAAYCRKLTNYREEILSLILDPKIYNFNTPWDVDCAIDCIKILHSPEVEEPPMESIFTLMQNMCKELFRNSKASYELLKILLKLLDQIWTQDDTMRQNCIIMVKGYMQRSGNLYYPPRMAALVYECAAKIIWLNMKQDHDFENTFMEALMEKVKSDVHSLRLYCCYLLRLVIVHQSDVDVESHLASLLDIFVIKVSERKPLILKDESANRTLTMLHSFHALAQTKNTLLNNIITEVMQMQKEKSLDKDLVKKVLNKITNMVIKTNIEVYLNDNILSVVHFWFSKDNSLESLPVDLFGFSTMNAFLERHMKWTVAADILWRKSGIIKNSDVVRRVVQMNPGKSVEKLIEECISHINILCLPYIVIEHYGIDIIGNGKYEGSENGIKMFNLAQNTIGQTKWSSLFIENISEFMTLVATHLSDPSAAKEEYQVNIPKQSSSYYYPKEVFAAIINYIGVLIEGSIMQYLCENNPMVIFKSLFKLWGDVLHEKVFEYKVLRLHTYMTFLEYVPMGYSSDAFVCNFVNNSLGHAIKGSQSKVEIKILIKALKTVLHMWLPGSVEVLRKSVSQLLSTLMIKKEEGFANECTPLINYLVIDMKDYLDESEDVVDFISSLSQGVVKSEGCKSMTEFMKKLTAYKRNLSYPSHETLINMKQFLKVNTQFVIQLCDDLKTQGFSEDCGSSMIHQIIDALCQSLQTATDDKTLIETCNCLVVIGNYDLKTLVTVPPADTQKVTNIKPTQFFTMIVMKTLAEVLFDEDPAVTNKVAKTLRTLFKYREGKNALDLEDVDKKILTPFSTTDENTSAVFKINNVEFKALCAAQHWIPNEKENHCQWLTRITVALINLFTQATNFTIAVREACLSKPSICRNILPPLMGLLLECASEQHSNLIGNQINQFFKHIWDMNFHDKVENSYDSNTHKTNVLNQDTKKIVQYMLDIVNFVRLQSCHYKARPGRTLETLNYLRLEYDKVAWAATVADQNFTAIFYAELWAMAQNNGVPPSSPEATTNIAGGENVQQILRKCFVSIGEMDAIDGCGTSHLTSEDEKRKHLLNTGHYTDALILHDIALSYDPVVDHRLQYGAVKALHKSGMHHLALQYIKSLPENDELNDIKYECLSFLGDWSDFVDTRDLEEKSKQTNVNPHSIVNALRYSCLKDCLNLQTTTDFESKLVIPLNRAKIAVSRVCQNLNMENCQSIYKILTKLHLFSDIEEYFSVRTNKAPIETLLTNWQVENMPAFHDYKHVEALIMQRSLLLEHAVKVYNTSLKDIVLLQLQYAELSLSNQRVQVAQRLLAAVKKVQNSDEVALVDSQISWAKGHKDIALSLLRNIVSNPSPDVKLTAISLRQYGMWAAESKRENARDIIYKYLKKSLEVLKTNDHEETRLKVYYDIAKFADAEYKQVVAYMNSSIFEKKVKCVENMKDTAISLRSTSTQKTLTKDERKALAATARFGEIDEAEIASTRAEKNSLLHLAMRYYLLSLKQGEGNNLSVFRVISLWLDNPSIELADSEQGSFADLLHAIPSRKYVTVLPQLAPRLTEETSEFAEHLRRIIKRCAVEHPHHTLPILFSLKNSDKDKQILNSSAAKGASQSARVPEPRVAAADSMVTQLAQENAVLTIIIGQLEKMCDATISFANFTPKTKETRQKIPSAERIHRLGHLDAIPVPTVPIPISSTCQYSYISTLHSFDNYFELVGGINCPKKIRCRGSDGKTRILLVKGEDDLRQDAMMQQVFNIVNTLLEDNPVTSRNKLYIRTYKVVPMSRRSGVLEWCEGTMPIGSYLLGTTGAHARYRPKDISAQAARMKLTALYEKRRPNEEKLVAFLKVLTEFKPVFHYFFTEHYLDHVTWYERRLAYTKSVASSSMVGYILGLGDRHLQNILIDKRTGDVVHIDFGIAFDQGKTLPTPETIPFRLTQDIVAGFGSSGVEGIFRRCCEKTMQLLRDNQETLLTILEVLLCDPLFSWTVNTKQENISTLPPRTLNTSDIQSSDSDGSLAKRALLTVSSKLSGTEGGVAAGVAVPGQVARLITTAMDPVNLSRLYHGWQPYL